MSNNFQDDKHLPITAVTALATWGIFKRYEPDKPLQLTMLLLVLPAALSYLEFAHFTSYKNVLNAVLSTFGVFYGVMISVILLYRISPFHPLAKYPGPFLHKLSKFRMAWELFQRKKYLGVDITYFQKLHQQYGDYVRIGPNELSILDAGAIFHVLGATGLPKGPFWDGRVPPGVTRSLISERDPAEHLRRRKPWNRAFSQPSVQSYEDIVWNRTAQFGDALLKESQKGPVDLDLWISFYTYDVMGDLAFGGGFEMMREGHDHTGVSDLMDGSFVRNNITAHVPYTLQYVIKLPIWGTHTNFQHFASERVAIRKREGALNLRKDLFHHLIDEEGHEPSQPPMKELMSDGLLAIVAGSDTTAHVLANVYYQLMSNPRCMAKLQAEIDDAFPAGVPTNNPNKHADMPYLNAVINEALRLQPPVPNGAQRSTQYTGGRMIGDNYIPPQTQVSINTYAVQRDPRYFYPRSEEFWPERWLEESERDYKGDDFVHDIRAFFPFSFGPAMCVGRPLAYMQMRMSICSILQRFDMKLPPGSESIEAYLIAGRGVMPTTLTPRS